MNYNQSKTYSNPQQPIFHRVGEKVFDYNWNLVKITERKNWKYIVINGKQFGVNSLKDESGISYPIWFGFIFEGIGNFDYFEAFKSKP